MDTITLTQIGPNHGWMVSTLPANMTPQIYGYPPGSLSANQLPAYPGIWYWHRGNHLQEPLHLYWITSEATMESIQAFLNGMPIIMERFPFPIVAEIQEAVKAHPLWPYIEPHVSWCEIDVPQLLTDIRQASHEVIFA